MRILHYLMGMFAVGLSLLVTALTVSISGTSRPIAALVSVVAIVLYFWYIFKNDETDIEGDACSWCTQAIGGFFLILFVNFFSCSFMLR